MEHSVIWVKTYVFSTFDNKEDFSRFKLFSESIFFMTVAVYLLIPILQCANAHLSNILRVWIKTNYWLFFGTKVILAFYVAHFAIQPSLFFLFWSQYSKANQNDWASHFIYPLIQEKCILSILTKNNDYDAFSLNLRIFKIYLLCIKQN